MNFFDNLRAWLLFFLSCIAPIIDAADPISVRPVGLNLADFSYYGSGPFANTMLTGTDWQEIHTISGTRADLYHRLPDNSPNPQFDKNGYPRYLNPQTHLLTSVFPNSADSTKKTPASPVRSTNGIGLWLLTWTGDGDVRLESGTFVAALSNTATTGNAVNGRRVYMVSDKPKGSIRICGINPANPLTAIRAWLPDPDAPMQRSLENSASMWHPHLLRAIASMDFNHLRFMDWGGINASPQQDWADRRPPGFRNQHGVLHRRGPTPTRSGNRNTGIAYEHMVNLCNTTGRDLWVCVPHLASDAYVTNLARLIRYGSNGTNPYSSTQVSPVFPPLLPHLRVWVEYSNEIWSSGDSFAQGEWAFSQASAAGLSKPVFIARRYAQIWKIFQQQFSGGHTVLRVAGIHTAGLTGHTVPMLTELQAYGATLNPQVSVDVVAPTIYFGNGMQDWVFDQSLAARTTNQPWFHGPEHFVNGNGQLAPETLPVSNPYWTSATYAAHQDRTFIEWKHRIFSGSSAEGGGPDATGTGGGFDIALPEEIFRIFNRRLPLVAYEGGPSMYTDNYDGADERDDGITNFIGDLNRLPQFAEIYRIQLNMARAKGLDTLGMFNDVGRWSKYGQWGHREYDDQPLAGAVKWQAVKDWQDDMGTIRHPAHISGTKPYFVTANKLPTGQALAPYQQHIVVAGGNIAVKPTLRVIGSVLTTGLSVAVPPSNPWSLRISGTPQTHGWNYVFARVNDDDGDADWRIFSFYISGGPDVLVEVNFSGNFMGTADLPFTPTYTIHPHLLWSGLSPGAPFVNSGGTAIGADGIGVKVDSDIDAITFRVSQGSTSAAESTLLSALIDKEYWTCTLTPKPGKSLDLRGTTLRLEWERFSGHSPTHFAVFTNLSDFLPHQSIFQLSSNSTPKSGESVTQDVRFPDSSVYGHITTPCEIRVAFFGSRYSHQARLRSFLIFNTVSRSPVITTPVNAEPGQLFLP